MHLSTLEAATLLHSALAHACSLNEPQGADALAVFLIDGLHSRLILNVRRTDSRHANTSSSHSAELEATPDGFTLVIGMRVIDVPEKEKGLRMKTLLWTQRP
jgi:hypothetical protein